MFGVAILVAVFTAAGSYASTLSFLDGFVSAMGVCAALALAAALAALAVPSRYRSTPAPSGDTQFAAMAETTQPQQPALPRRDCAAAIPSRLASRAEG